MIAVSSVLPVYFGTRSAEAGWIQGATALISAAVAAVDLYKKLWHVSEPTEGSITFINYNDHQKNGDLWLGILQELYGVDPYIENYALLPFDVPSRRMITNGFRDGPYGRKPGDKIMEGRSSKGTYRTNMVVEV